MRCWITTGCGPSWEAEAGGTGKGYDVYRPEPYLLVAEAADPHSVSQGSPSAATQPISQMYTAKIIYLPDYSTRYRIRSNSGGVDIWIKDGWQLSSLSDQNNAAQALQALAGGASQAGNAGGDALSALSLLGGQPISAQGSLYPSRGGGNSGTGPVAQHGLSLYKIIYNSDGRVRGLVRIEPSEDAAMLKTTLSDHAPPRVPTVASDK